MHRLFTLSICCNKIVLCPKLDRIISNYVAEFYIHTKKKFKIDIFMEMSPKKLRNLKQSQGITRDISLKGSPGISRDLKISQKISRNLMRSQGLILGLFMLMFGCFTLILTFQVSNCANFSERKSLLVHFFFTLLACLVEFL